MVELDLLCSICGCSVRTHLSKVLDPMTGYEVPVCQEHGPCWWIPILEAGKPHPSIWIQVVL